MSNFKPRYFAQLKRSYKDAVLVFRCGDYYEVYQEDAKEVSKILGITLVMQVNHYVASFPYHAFDIYLPKMIRAGKRVAIIDEYK